MRSRILNHLAAVLVLFLAAKATGTAPYWVENQGQWEGDFQFKCEVGSAVYYVTPEGMTVDFREFRRYPRSTPPNPPAHRGGGPEESRDSVTVRGHVVQIHYSSLPPQSAGGLRGVGQNKLPHYSNYFLGRDSTKWRSRVGHYQNIVVPEVWPGIDVEYRADQLGVETVYHVSPGADPSQIQMEYLGLDAPLRVDAQGNLVLATSLGEMKEKTPFAFQQEARVQQRVDAGFQLLGEGRIAYTLGHYNSNQPLAIDPLIYSTYIGGGNPEHIEQFLPLQTEEILICGYSGSTDFPTTPGAYQEHRVGRQNAYIGKLSDDARELVFATLFGSTEYVYGRDADLLPDGSLVLAGHVVPDGSVPLTQDALDTMREDYEGYIALFDSTCGSLLYSSYLGGSDQEIIEDVAVSSRGEVLLTGRTSSSDFPVSPDALEPVLIGGGNAMLVLLDVIEPAIIYSSFFGRTGCEGYDLVLVNDSTFWLSGQAFDYGLTVTDDAYQSTYGGGIVDDAFLAHFQLNPPTLLYSTYLGGSNQDEIFMLELVEAGRLALFGSTTSDIWPTTHGVYDSVLNGANQSEGFVTIFAEPDTIVQSTLFGREFHDLVTVGARSPDGSYVIAGETKDQNLPVTPDAVDPAFGPNVVGETTDLFVVRLSPDLSSLEYCSYYGGHSHERFDHLWIQDANTYWFTGFTSSNDFPVTPDALDPEIGGIDTDGFISCIGISSGVNRRMPIEVPSCLQLSAFPNPFNPTTTLSFTLPRSAEVALTIRNVLGQEVESVNIGRMSAGEHRYAVNAERWASGIYFASVETGEWVRTVKVVVLK